MYTNSLQAFVEKSLDVYKVSGDKQVICRWFYNSTKGNRSWIGISFTSAYVVLV